MSTLKTNPFHFGTVVTGNDFCQRDELSVLCEQVRAGQHVHLSAEHRSGKTSLACQAAVKLKGFQALHVDMAHVGSLRDLNERVINAFAAGKSISQLLGRLAGDVSSLNPVISMSQYWPRIKLEARIADEIGGLRTVLHFLRQEHATTRKRFLVLDGFQSIIRIPQHEEIVAILRNEFQHFSGSVVFITVKSEDTRRLFYDRTKPFWGSVSSTLALDDIPWPRFQAFLEAKCKPAGLRFAEGLWEEIHEITGGHLSNTQQLCSALWDIRAGRTLSDKDLPAACELIFATYKLEFGRQWSELTEIQKKVLRTIAKIGGRHITSRDFIEASGVSHAATIKRALGRLQRDAYVYEKDNDQVFLNPFFRLWILNQWP